MKKRKLIVPALVVTLFAGGFISPQLRGIYRSIGSVLAGTVDIDQDNAILQNELPLKLNKAVLREVKMYSTSGKRFFSASLANSTAYVAIIQDIFARYDIPRELAYLALVESGYNNYALSRVYAHGMWQFMAPTARGYGLRVNRQVDERRDFIRATHAAARYLRDLHARFNDWYLAIAAYNAGGGYISGMLRATGARDFWELLATGRLYTETAHYVPRVLAAAHIARNPLRYGFTKVKFDKPLRLVRVPVKGLTPLYRVAAQYNVSLAVLRKYNPHFKSWRVPAGREYLVNFPEAVKYQQHDRDSSIALAESFGNRI